jgi:hypothetical protein
VHSATKNNTLPGITDFINKNATKPTKIVQILLAKTLEIELIKVNANN